MHIVDGPGMSTISIDLLLYVNGPYQRPASKANAFKEACLSISCFSAIQHSSCSE